MRPSAAEVLKIPYIEKQMELLKNTMMDKHYAKDNKDSVSIEPPPWETLSQSNTPTQT